MCAWGGSEPLHNLHTAVTCFINSEKEILLGAILWLKTQNYKGSIHTFEAIKLTLVTQTNGENLITSHATLT
jgi:hypothetical protein